jgi:pSer/pThr/pTyr-binding forkhead associated (FHA) protein
MRDGHTQRLKRAGQAGGIEHFLTRFQAKVVIVSGRRAGDELSLDRERLTFGRGPGVDVAFDDPTMSRQHAVVEYSRNGFRIRDLGSTNGTVVNGSAAQAADLKHGDAFQIGSVRFQLVIEEIEPAAEAYELPS